MMRVLAATVVVLAASPASAAAPTPAVTMQLVAPIACAGGAGTGTLRLTSYLAEPATVTAYDGEATLSLGDLEINGVVLPPGQVVDVPIAVSGPLSWPFPYTYFSASWASGGWGQDVEVVTSGCSLVATGTDTLAALPDYSWYPPPTPIGATLPRPLWIANRGMQAQQVTVSHVSRFQYDLVGAPPPLPDAVPEVTVTIGAGETAAVDLAYRPTYASARYSGYDTFNILGSTSSLYLYAQHESYGIGPAIYDFGVVDLGSADEDPIYGDLTAGGVDTVRAVSATAGFSFQLRNGNGFVECARGAVCSGLQGAFYFIDTWCDLDEAAPTTGTLRLELSNAEVLERALTCARAYAAATVAPSGPAALRVCAGAAASQEIDITAGADLGLRGDGPPSIDTPDPAAVTLWTPPLPFDYYVEPLETLPLRVEVSAAAPPGQYPTTVEVTFENHPTLTSSVQIEVLDEGIHPADADVTFGEVAIGTAAFRSTRIDACLAAPVEIVSIDAPEGFLATTDVAVLSPLSAAQLQVAFGPAAARAYAGTITMQLANGQTIEWDVSGTGTGDEVGDTSYYDGCLSAGPGLGLGFVALALACLLRRRRRQPTLGGAGVGMLAAFVFAGEASAGVTVTLPKAPSQLDAAVEFGQVSAPFDAFVSSSEAETLTVELSLFTDEFAFAGDCALGGALADRCELTLPAQGNATVSLVYTPQRHASGYLDESFLDGTATGSTINQEVGVNGSVYGYARGIATTLGEFAPTDLGDLKSPTSTTWGQLSSGVDGGSTPRIWLTSDHPEVFSFAAFVNLIEFQAPACTDANPVADDDCAIDVDYQALTIDLYVECDPSSVTTPTTFTATLRAAQTASDGTNLPTATRELRCEAGFAGATPLPGDGAVILACAGTPVTTQVQLLSTGLVPLLGSATPETLGEGYTVSPAMNQGSFLELAPGARHRVDVTLDGNAAPGPHPITFTWPWTNLAPTTHTLTTHVVGGGVGAAVEDVAFEDAVPVGRAAVRTVDLRACAAEAIEITEVSATGAFAAALDRATFNPDEPGQLAVYFAPLAEGEATGEVTVRWAGGEWVLPVRGLGGPGEVDDETNESTSYYDGCLLSVDGRASLAPVGLALLVLGARRRRRR